MPLARHVHSGKGNLHDCAHLKESNCNTASIYFAWPSVLVLRGPRVVVGRTLLSSAAGMKPSLKV